MHSSTGQCASHKGEPAQLEQFSSITASSAVPLRFLVASAAMRFDPRFLESSLEKECQRNRQQNPPVSNQPDAPPLQPVNKIGRARYELAQNLLRRGIIPHFAQRL